MTAWYWTLSNTHFSVTAFFPPASPTEMVTWAWPEASSPPPLVISCLSSSLGALHWLLMNTDPTSDNKRVTELSYFVSGVPLNSSDLNSPLFAFLSSLIFLTAGLKLIISKVSSSTQRSASREARAQS